MHCLHHPHRVQDPPIVLSPNTHAVTDPTPYTLYSVLRTTQEILGLPLLGAATTSTSMTNNFGL